MYGEDSSFGARNKAEEVDGSYVPPGSPTAQQYEAFDRAFDHFNSVLFAGFLPLVLLTFSRKPKAMGFFAAERWTPAEVGADHRVHEIALNPDHLRRIDLRDVASTLVHEMTHLWQQVHGKASRRGYHNKEWGDQMESVGLMPSSTGRPGGKRTGQRCSHYVIDGGLFDLAWMQLPKGVLLPFLSAVPPSPNGVGPSKQIASKTKFSCPGCGANTWGKPDLSVAHVPCGLVMVPSA